MERPIKSLYKYHVTTKYLKRIGRCRDLYGFCQNEARVPNTDFSE